VNTLYANTTGFNNTAYGPNALRFNDIGYNNTAVGVEALFNNTSGINNVAVGPSVQNSTTGSQNVGVGINALNGLQSGNNNTAVGASAGGQMTTGSFNTMLGVPGSGAQGAGDGVITGNHNIAIASISSGDESNTIRIGESSVQSNTYIAGIFGITIASGSPAVVIGSDGHLGTVDVSTLQGPSRPSRS
jgi:trimeric autotransporter adhesin